MKLRWWAINPFAFNLDTVHTNAKVIVKETSKSTFLYLISYKQFKNNGYHKILNANTIILWEQNIAFMTEIFPELEVVWQEKPTTGNHDKLCCKNKLQKNKSQKKKIKLNDKIETSSFLCRHRICSKHPDNVPKTLSA